jgi:tripartite-type tricarboxylate transporter receptor subunit TctC
MTRYVRRLAAALLLAAGFVAGAAAQGTPASPIRVIVPFPPAGGTDILARLVANAVAESTKWNLFIDNRPGAGGTLGLDLLAQARPDGATFGVGQTANLAIGPSLYEQLSFNPLKDLAPVVLIASQPNVLVVRADSPYRTLPELITAARAKPGALSLGSPGSGTVAHLAGEMLGMRAGFKLVHVPYKGTAPALNDVMGGQIDFMMTPPTGVMPLVRAGKLAALGVTSLRRLPALPSVPTVAESGYAGFVAVDWKGVLAPAGTPVAALQAMNSAVNAALVKPQIVSRLEAEGSIPLGGTSAELAALMKSEIEAWGAAVRKTGAKAD